MLQLPDALIDDIVAYLKQSYDNEQKCFKQLQEALRKELNQIKAGFQSSSKYI